MFFDTHTEPESLPPASGSSESAEKSGLTSKEAAAGRELREASLKEETGGQPMFALAKEETAGQPMFALAKEETAGQPMPAPSEEAQGRFLKNPLPLPERRPHVRMEFDLMDDWDIPEEEDHFDLEIREDDDFDI